MTEKGRSKKQPVKEKQPESDKGSETAAVNPTRGPMVGAISFAVTAVQPNLSGNIPAVSAVVAWLEFGLQIAEEAPVLAKLIRYHLSTAPRSQVPEVPAIGVSEFIEALEAVMESRGLDVKGGGKGQEDPGGGGK